MRTGTLKRAAAAALTVALTLSAPERLSAGATPFVGEIMIFAGNFCPRGWARADGQLLAISSNDALFSLYGTIYGGDGRTTFALPDLRGRTPIHHGQGPGLADYRIGSRGGATQFTLTQNEMPAHTHAVNATNKTADRHGPGGDLLAAPYHADNTQLLIYHEGPPNRAMDPGVIGHTGGSQAQTKRSPGLGMTMCVSLFGIYPSRN